MYKRQVASSLAGRPADIKRVGPVSLDLCKVADGTYDAGVLYRKPGIKLLVDFITNPAFMATGNAERLQRLHDDIKDKDWFMALLDIEEYIQTKERVLADYEDQDAWMRKALINIANAGTFSSDRTISQYNDEIWHLN